MRRLVKSIIVTFLIFWGASIYITNDPLWFTVLFTPSNKVFNLDTGKPYDPQAWTQMKVLLSVIFISMTFVVYVVESVFSPRK